METQGSPGDSAHDAVAAAQRAQVLVHTCYPDPGPWYPLLAGAWAASFTAAYALPFLAWALVAAGLFIAGGAWVRHYINRRGVMPSMSSAPAVIQQAFNKFLIAYVLLIALTIGAYLGIGWWAGALVAGIGLGLVVWDYERRYAVAARSAEEAVGIMTPASHAR